MISVLIATLVVAVVVSGAGFVALHRSASYQQRRAQVSVDLHRTRNQIEGAMFEQAVRSDGRRLRRELRHELDELERNQ